MKTKGFFRLVFVSFVIIQFGCVGELPEEQFDKYVLLTRNGWIEQDIEFSAVNVAELPIAVSISGTSGNKQNVAVKLEYDTDMLDRYNLEKYKLQKELYYVPVPENAITFITDVTIPSGSEDAVANLTIDFNKITDPYKDYVIPIRIASTSDFLLQDLEQTAILKRSEVLYHIRRVNSFSGNYTGSSTVYQTNGRGTIQSPYIKKGTGSPVTIKTLYALSDNECYFFAGQFDRSHVQSNEFIVNVRMDENDSLIFSSPNPALQLNVNRDIIRDALPNTISTSFTDVPTDQRKVQVKKTFEFYYTLYDLTDKSDSTATNNHILYVEGNMSRIRTEMKK